MRELAEDSRGNKQRDLGRKVVNGQIKQHRFYLGTDKATAQIRAIHLEKTWECVQNRWKRERGAFADLNEDEGPTWDVLGLQIAMAVSKGEKEVLIDPHAHPEVSELAHEPEILAKWFVTLTQDFAGLPVNLVLATEQAVLDDGIRLRKKQAERLIETAQGLRGEPTSQTLHPALEGYRDHLATKYGLAGFGKVAGNETTLLKFHIDDISLNELTANRLELWQRFYENRPNGQRGKMLKKRSCVNQIKRLRDFANWLNKEPAFRWRRPYDLDWPQIKVRETGEELAARANPDQVQTYTLDELAILWEYALPSERAYLIFALNCAFARAEIGSLLQREIILNKAHRKYGTVGNWIFKVRPKTRVYGEWELFPETVHAIEWLLKHRPESAHDNLFLDANGGLIIESTRGGNANQAIPSAWQRLTNRVRKDHGQFKDIGFKFLRKTMTNLVRDEFGGEVANIFGFHGSVLGEGDILEVYSNKPFWRVHQACVWLRQKLAPLFAKVPDPFPDQPEFVRPAISLGKIKEIKDLASQGIGPNAISSITGVPETTVRRYCRGVQPNALISVRTLNRARKMRSQGYKIEKIATVLDIPMAVVRRLKIEKPEPSPELPTATPPTTGEMAPP
jgi:hypothetical protein